MDSFSKTCAAIILLLLLSAGAVALDAKAEDYTPEETAQEEQEQLVREIQSDLDIPAQRNRPPTSTPAAMCR